MVALGNGASLTYYVIDRFSASLPLHLIVPCWFALLLYEALDTLLFRPPRVSQNQALGRTALP